MWEKGKDISERHQSTGFRRVLIGAWISSIPLSSVSVVSLIGGRFYQNRMELTLIEDLIFVSLTNPVLYYRAIGM